MVNRGDENGILFSVVPEESKPWLRATAALKSVDIELEGHLVKSHAQSRRLCKHLTKPGRKELA